MSHGKQRALLDTGPLIHGIEVEICIRIAARELATLAPDKRKAIMAGISEILGLLELRQK